MLFLLRRCYHVRKPRVITPNQQSLIDYKKQLRDARRQVHIQAKDYQNKIEDEYLQKHKEQMAAKHEERQSSFRKACFVHSFRVYQNQKRWARQNALFDDKLNKHLHDQDMRRINRSRILKIMQHESNNFWFNQQNAQQRLTEEVIFPQYIASTQYYYKLFAEALAYELGDLEQVHMVTSNQQIIKEKNKYLIPLYLSLRKQIADFKRDDVKEEIQRISYQIQRIRKSGKFSGKQLEDIVNQEQQKSNEIINKIKQRTSTQAQRLNLFKQKVVHLVAILKTWKQYTNVLALTSAQILRNQYAVQDEISISRTQKDIFSQLKAKSSQTFIGSIEQDTEQYEMSFEEYLNKVNLGRKETQVTGQDTSNMDQLSQLIEDLKGNQASSEPIQQPQELDIGSLLKNAIPDQQKVQPQSAYQNESLESKVNPQFLNVRETTSSVQILKQTFGSDADFMVVLNQLGEIDVRYSRLFKSVWDTVHV